MTIHTTHPFADAEPDPVRRFRGRLGGAVTLWTAGVGVRPGRAHRHLGDDRERRGAARPGVSSTLTPISSQSCGRPARRSCQLLAWGDRDLAEAFAGTAPAPGGAFRMAEFEDAPQRVRAWRARRRTPRCAWWRRHEVGWSVLVTCRVERAVVGDEDGPMLGHRRGRYFRLGSTS